LLRHRLRVAGGSHRACASDRTRRKGRVRNPAGAPVPAREQGGVTDLAWIDATLRSARPQAVGALLRYFRDLDQAEEAFQEACLRALKHWTANGPPRDPVAWLILVGRNVALDDVRRRGKHEPLPEDDASADDEDAEADMVERLDSS